MKIIRTLLIIAALALTLCLIGATYYYYVYAPRMTALEKLHESQVAAEKAIARSYIIEVFGLYEQYVLIGKGEDTKDGFIKLHKKLIDKATLLKVKIAKHAWSDAELSTIANKLITSTDYFVVVNSVHIDSLLLHNEYDMKRQDLVNQWNSQLEWHKVGMHRMAQDMTQAVGLRIQELDNDNVAKRSNMSGALDAILDRWLTSVNDLAAAGKSIDLISENDSMFRTFTNLSGE